MIAFSPPVAREALRRYLADSIDRGVRRGEQVDIRAALGLAGAAADPCRTHEAWREWALEVLGHDPLEAP